MTSNRRVIPALLAVAALVGAACGSTVPLEEQQVAEAAAVQGAAGGGLAVDSSGNPVGGSGAFDSGTGSSFSGSSMSGSSGLASSAGGTSGSTGSSSTTTGTSGGAVAPGENAAGVSASEVKIGFSFPTDGEEANAALGGAGATSIEYRRAYDAMVEWVNDNGGVGNRRMTPVYHNLSVYTSETRDQQDQEMCAHFTQDDPVFMSDGGFKTENGIACLEKAGNVVVVSNTLLFESAAFFDKYPHFVEYDGIDNDDMATLYVDSLQKMNYFKGAKVGIITWDHPNYAPPVQQSLIPRLKKYGVEPMDVSYISYNDNYDDYANMVSQLSNTAVRFKSEGVTHILFMDEGANLAFFFMQTAQRQQYYPLYGLNTSSGFTTMADLLRSGGDEDARQQLKGSVGVGWLPTIDVAPDDFPAWAQPSTKKLCQSIMQKGGVTVDSANARAQAESVCSSVWTMDAMLEAAGDVLNQDTFTRGLDRVDLELQPPSGMGFAVSSQRRDGNAYAALPKFYDKCVCYRYTTDRFDVPST